MLDRCIYPLTYSPSPASTPTKVDSSTVAKRSQSNLSGAFAPSQHSAFSHRSSILDKAASIAASSAFGAATSSLVGRIGGALQQNFMNNLDKLFLERMEVYGKSIQPENRNGVMQSLVKIILKTFMEITRLRTLGKSGYQQIQVDVEYIRMHFWRFVPEEKLVNQMVDEVMASALARCLEPTAMEYSVVEKILS